MKPTRPRITAKSRKPQVRAKKTPKAKRTAAAASAAPTRRDALIVAIKGLEQVLQVCHLSSAPNKRFFQCIQMVRKCVRQHTRMTESPEGLLTHIEEHHPRLLSKARELRQEHAQIDEKLAKLEKDLNRGPAASPRAYQDVCRDAGELLEALRQHHEHGAELLFEAYVSEVGTKD